MGQLLKFNTENEDHSLKKVKNLENFPGSLKYDAKHWAKARKNLAGIDF